MKNLQKVALRQNKVYLSQSSDSFTPTNAEIMQLVATLRKYGFILSENLFYSLNIATDSEKQSLLENIEEALGTKLNWTPLVKNWQVPTGESIIDHWLTLIANLINAKQGTKLACGHLIPDNTFPLERYNGCPFCGTPFEYDKQIFSEQNSKFKYLDLWTEKEAKQYFVDLLNSAVPLDATQADSLKILLNYFALPENIQVGMKETQVLVIDELIKQNKEKDCVYLFSSPTDILRYLWYKKTDILRIVEPKTLLNQHFKNNLHINVDPRITESAREYHKQPLKLKYSRKECLMVAYWLNHLSQRLDLQSIAENMHPKRGMWVRFIRALRLAEYSKRKGFEPLKDLLDLFYRQDYKVWQAEVDQARQQYDIEKTFYLLKQRPGLFARSLFANMLHFGVPDIALDYFKQVIDKIPMRLLLTLNMHAEIYFDRKAERSVETILGNRKTIKANKQFAHYSDDEIKHFRQSVEDLCLFAFEQRFKRQENHHQSIYIAPELYHIPLPIGERPKNLQDITPTLMGEKFKLEGKNIRLFMQWGKGLPAQHLDMDLSCEIVFVDKTEYCSFYRLSSKAYKHSGDIRSIPDNIGTAEYIELDIEQLIKQKAKYVNFACNAYSMGNISPNLVVGWMDSKYPMKVSEKSGVAYDPSCVIHQVRISQSTLKGLVFGVLDIEQQEIIWLEMPFDGQTVNSVSFKSIQTFLNKLQSRTSIGNLLEIKAKAQGLNIVSDKNQADEIYDINWARNTGNINSLFLN